MKFMEFPLKLGPDEALTEKHFKAYENNAFAGLRHFLISRSYQGIGPPFTQRQQRAHHPDAVQVIDRFHLIKGLSEAINI